jgi:hypothetical protein
LLQVQGVQQVSWQVGARMTGSQIRQCARQPIGPQGVRTCSPQMQAVSQLAVSWVPMKPCHCQQKPLHSSC